MTKPRLVLFDLDHTLLAGDSDVLWCEFLMDKGLLDRAQFALRNADMESRYQAGTVSTHEFAGFYVRTLAGHSPESLEGLRGEFLREAIVPRIPSKAMALVKAHLDAGELCVMTTATNRYITQLTAAHFGIAHLLATETEIEDGMFTGRPSGTLNMREGKVARLNEWLSARGEQLRDYTSTAYSDSINDQPLLEAVDEPVAVDPDPRLLRLATARGWKLLHLR
ncbi:MAG TPA: HAD family hydrolase [Ramlibacter sp.]|nr:HAD family hydrolase [Ramlibacter sp.]